MTTTSLPFTTSLSTAIGRVRSRLGLVDEGGPDRVEDARIQEYLDATSTENDAMLMMVDAMLAKLARQIRDTQMPASGDVYQINSYRDSFDAWTRVRASLVVTLPTTTGLPIRTFGSLGAHPSDPRRC